MERVGGFFVVSIDKRLNKQPSGLWNETPYAYVTSL